MKIIVGIDGSGHDRAALDLISRLQFTPPATVDLATVVPAPAQIAASYTAMAAVNLNEILTDIRDGGKQILEDAKTDACARNLNPGTILLEGYPAESLSEFAAENHADLVAVTAKPKGTIACLFAGSVARSLAIASEQSILVAREPEKGRGPVSAVFATDHSEYANRCLDRFLSWKPAGISHVRVISAYDTMGHESARFGGTVAVRVEEIETYIAARVKDETEAVAEKFRGAGIAADATIVRGNARDAIHSAMMEDGADLLILGARGHGFWERLTLGSTALHQVVAEPYSILIVREPEAKH